jgi:hypothetical protein
MAFRPHLRVSAIGTLGSTGEQFSYSLSMAERADGNFLDSLFLSANEDVFSDVCDDVATYHGRATTRLRSAAVLTHVKVAAIGADGKYLSDPYIKDYNVPGAESGGGSTPPQVSLAISLVTARRGPSGKGRFYLPLPAWGVDSNSFLIQEQNANDSRGSAVTLINDLNNQPGIDVLGLGVVVASTKGYNTPVTGVRVGRVLDTVRTRRNKLQEQYTGVAAVA